MYLPGASGGLEDRKLPAWSLREGEREGAAWGSNGVQQKKGEQLQTG